MSLFSSLSSPRPLSLSNGAVPVMRSVSLSLLTAALSVSSMSWMVTSGAAWPASACGADCAGAPVSDCLSAPVPASSPEPASGFVAASSPPVVVFTSGSAWIRVDVPMVVSSAYAAETADAPEPNSIADASMSAATFLRPGFIVFLPKFK